MYENDADPSVIECLMGLKSETTMLIIERLATSGLKEMMEGVIPGAVE